MKSQKIFRYLWRVNGVLILVAMGTITFAVGSLLLEEFARNSVRNREAETGIPVAAPDSSAHLSLGRAVLVPGTDVMRADLTVNREGKSLSSSGYNETRNILFINPSQGEAHWLLPDNDHVIWESSDVPDEKDPKTKRIIATAALVKPAIDRPDTVNGRLLLFEPSGKKTVDVANDVREIHVASLFGGELTILYERERRLVLAAFDPGSLAKKREQKIEVPQLK
jgi:hypothetical protein